VAIPAKEPNQPLREDVLTKQYNPNKQTIIKAILFFWGISLEKKQKLSPKIEII
jgi:hypothetical protein